MIFSSETKVPVLTEAQKEEIFDLRARASKIKALNDHLDIIHQKKVRLDDEIKKIEKKLKSLKSKTIKEGANLDSSTTEPLSEDYVPEALREALEQELARADRLLKEVEEDGLSSPEPETQEGT